MYANGVVGGNYENVSCAIPDPCFCRDFNFMTLFNKLAVQSFNEQIRSELMKLTVDAVDSLKAFWLQFFAYAA